VRLLDHVAQCGVRFLVRQNCGTSGDSPVPPIFPEPSRAVRCDPFSRTSSLHVLSLHVVKGKIGFVCLVERSWTGPVNWSEFWNPNVRGPVCFNPPAVRSVVPITYKRTELALAGLSRAQLIASLQDAIRKQELSALEPGTTCYMMSKQGQIGAAVGHWHPHLLFYSHRSEGADWSAELPGSPVLLNSQFQGAPELLASFIVRVPDWADRAPVSGHAH
jgi:hypothetical protein